MSKVTNFDQNSCLFAAKLMQAWLEKQLKSSCLDWLKNQLKNIKTSYSEKLFYAAFSSIPRRIGKDDLCLTDSDLSQAEAIFSGWSPRYWSVDQVARALLLLTLLIDNINPQEKYQRTIELLFSNADVNELIALNQSLPLLPYPELYLTYAIDGIRSNITPVFNAIALNNPYPAKYFDELAWNQLVLKSLFIGSPLHYIQGLDRRANATLAQMLSDYAHERWAASRSVNPELWRPVGPFVEGRMLTDLQRLFQTGDQVQKEAAALACHQSPSIKAQELLSQYPDLQARIHRGTLSWDSFVQQHLLGT